MSFYPPVSGSQTVRLRGERQYSTTAARSASSAPLPPPPLPLAALQLPKSNRGAQISSPSGLHRPISLTGGSEHRITKWIAETLGDVGGQPPSKQIERILWPERPRSHQQRQRHVHIHHSSQPIPPFHSRSTSSIPPPIPPTSLASHSQSLPSLTDGDLSPLHALDAAQQTIQAQQLEIEILKQQTQNQMSLDLTYEELTLENRNLRQLKYVIQELERKLKEMKEMRSEKKRSAIERIYAIIWV